MRRWFCFLGEKEKLPPLTFLRSCSPFRIFQLMELSWEVSGSRCLCRDISIYCLKQRHHWSPPSVLPRSVMYVTAEGIFKKRSVCEWCVLIEERWDTPACRTHFVGAGFPLKCSLEFQGCVGGMAIRVGWWVSVMAGGIFSFQKHCRQLRLLQSPCLTTGWTRFWKDNPRGVGWGHSLLVFHEVRDHLMCDKSHLTCDTGSYL